MERVKKQVLRFFYLLTFMLLGCIAASAQSLGTVQGIVLDKDNGPVVGATVVVKGNSTMGTLTDFDGKFTLKVPESATTIVISFIGMKTQEVVLNGKADISVKLETSDEMLSEVVVVGYGEQKKESVVGSISQTDAKALQRTGGVTNLGAALTGNLPGVITIQSNGAPGEEDPSIFIRGQSTWNNSDPLVLVDGIERSMKGLDLNSVESISVLKDASATAVFGVKGANGVILITTKRGKEGRAQISGSASTTIKMPSKLPTKYDAYDALRIRNMAIEREVAMKEGMWADYTPYTELDKYRNPASIAESEQYPNINWKDELVKQYALSYKANVNIAGGTSFVKYYTAVDYTHEGDILKSADNGKGYNAGYGYDRINVRSNLDFKLTNSTTLSANIAGYHARKEDTWSGFEYRIWQAIYSMAPDVFPSKYSDGTWAYYPNDMVTNINSLQTLSNSGIRKTNTTQLNTDFTLVQELDKVLPGLKFTGKFSMDNSFVSVGGLRDEAGNAATKWISPAGEEFWQNQRGQNQYDYVVNPWTLDAAGMDNGQTFRKLFYQAQLFYGATFGAHDLTAMGLFSRDESAKGSVFPTYREDWVFRTTYNFLKKYFVEFNGSYNGSEKFGNDYRFAFFPSAAMGWMLSEEPFLKGISWLGPTKLRVSYGKVGDDSGAGRWLYMTQWSRGHAGGNAHLGQSGNDRSPYTWYAESAIGNSDIHWEVVTKQNIGLDYSFLKSTISGSVDVFKDHRTDILLDGGRRAVPAYFGGKPPTANWGEVVVKGFEFEVKGNHTFNNNIRLWGKFGFTRAKDEVLEADDPAFKDDYLKDQSYAIGQYRSQLVDGYVNNWDQVYGSTEQNTYDNEKMPGTLGIVDFNGDGIIDDSDAAPNNYSGTPQNTYSYSLGVDYKGFSAFVQFYGVNNVSRYMSYGNFGAGMNLVYDQGSYWSAENTNAESFLPRWTTHMYTGNYYAYDASYFRLKTVELSYTFDSPKLRNIGLGSLRVFVNGNNLFLWTNMPDDRESNGSTWGSQGAYPTMKRINLGINVTL